MFGDLSELTFINLKRFSGHTDEVCVCVSICSYILKIIIKCKLLSWGCYSSAMRLQD